MILLRSALSRVARLCRRDTPEPPQRPPRQEWIENYAIRNRPVLRSPEAELALLAEVVCGELGILPTQTPTPEQAKIIHSQVTEWIREVRIRTHIEPR